MTTLYLIRHGQYASPDHIIPYRLPGFHLSPKGISDVTRLAEALASRSIAAVYTSPMERTQETAAILAKPFHVTPIVDERLLEARSPAQGQKEGFLEARGGWDIYESDWFKEHNGESMADIAARMKVAIEDITLAHKNAEVIVVSHGDPIMLLVASYRGISLTPEALHAMQPYVPMAGGYTLSFNEEGEVLVQPITI